MAIKKGLVGMAAALGAAMLFVVSAAGGMLGGYDVKDEAAMGNDAGGTDIDAVASSTEALSADDTLTGYVLDNETGEGIANAIAVIIHIPDDVPQDNISAYVDRVLSCLRLARERLENRQDKLERLNDTMHQKAEKAQERLERANETLCKKKERLQDAVEEAREKHGADSRQAMKRIETAQRKLASEERKLERMQEKVDAACEKAGQRLREMRQDLRKDTEAFREKLAGKGIYIVKTDENGYFESSAADGTTAVVALAPGYRQGRLVTDVPTENGQPVTIRLDARPGAEVYRLKFVWGYLDDVDPEGEFTAWNGSISVSDGKVRAVRTIQFEHGGRFVRGGDDKVYPQRGDDSVSWRSSTTVARDGVVVHIIVPPDADARQIDVTLTAGEWTRTVSLARLAGQSLRISVGDAGHEVLVACELLGQPAM